MEMCGTEDSALCDWECSQLAVSVWRFCSPTTTSTATDDEGDDEERDDHGGGGG
jgi:hypothetical protein